MEAGSLLFYRADGVLVIRPPSGESYVASDRDREEAAAALLPPCHPECER